jgi:hypothetical protein
VQLVEYHPLERPEEVGRVGGGQDQRELLGRGEQDVRRIAVLALALRGGRVATAGLDADWQSHFGDWPLQVTRDINGERLQRRDVEGVQPAFAPDTSSGGDDLARARRHRAGLLPASVGRAPLALLRRRSGAHAER